MKNSTKNITSYKALCEKHLEFLQAQEELMEKGFYFCPKCLNLVSLENKAKGREKCCKCYRKELTEQQRKRRAKRRAERDGTEI